MAHINVIESNFSTISQPRLPENTILVHDYLNQHGGAERLLEVMVSMADSPPVYTSVYDPERMPDEYLSMDIRPNWINRIPGSRRNHQWALPAFPLSFEFLKLPPCDLVLSSSSAWAKMVSPPPGAVHISYIHAPMRFAWDFPQYGERERLPDPVRKVLPPYMSFLRWRDRATAPRVDQFIANSTAVRDRIRAFWRRDAAVIFPPVNVEMFQPLPTDRVEDYFLLISRLVPYKRIDIVIEAFNALGLPLRIIGEGRDRQSLERKAGPSITFLGRVSDEELREAYACCRAAIFMSEDDFGIAQVETQASGRPVIALAAGGVLDSVVPGVTGIWVRDRTAESLISGVKRFEKQTFSTETLVSHAQKFSVRRFKQELAELVDITMATYHAERQEIQWS